MILRVFVSALFLFVALPANSADLENGEEVYEVCAGCHGPFGQGGGGGVYPRLAGMDEEYLADQLEAFKSRKRENIPMLPYATERELPEEDIEDVSAYLSSIKLATKMPQNEKIIDGLERLNQAKLVLMIPREKGDLKKGEKFYQSACVKCHGKKGEGNDRGPLLAGQHIKYVATQIEHYINKQRRHVQTEKLFITPGSQLLQDLYAYLSILDD